MRKNVRYALSIAASGTFALLVGVSSAQAAGACATEEDRLAAEAVAAEVAIQCPCDAEWRNHGQYVSCVVRTAARLYRENDVPRSCGRNTRSCAARSTCGRQGGEAALCCVDVAKECLEDPTPGDTLAEGTCEDTESPCDTAEDCVFTRCRVTATADACTEIGGVAGGQGSCCGEVCSAVE
jgi:hypothetical protein